MSKKIESKLFPGERITAASSSYGGAVWVSVFDGDEAAVHLTASEALMLIRNIAKILEKSQ